MDKNLASAEGLIFDVQRYCIHDGPGIRTTVFLKGCPLKCPWCANPESQKSSVELEYIEPRCVRCRNCIRVCPAGAMREEGGKIAIDRALCTLCGQCWQNCLAGALATIGRTASVGEMVKLIQKDAPYYKRSGGGVTLSGGEPLRQADFSATLLKECKKLGLDTAMESSGCVPWAALLAVAQHVDHILYDLKHLNSQKHRDAVGVSNETILANLKKLPALGKEVIIRVPLIPGYNDDETNIGETADFAAASGIGEINLLPYHNMAEPKYRRLGRSYDCAHIKRPDEEQMRKLKSLIEARGVTAKIGG